MRPLALRSRSVIYKPFSVAHSFLELSTNIQMQYCYGKLRLCGFRYFVYFGKSRGLKALEQKSNFSILNTMMHNVIKDDLVFVMGNYFFCMLDTLFV